MVVEDNQWILGGLTTISKTGNQSVSTATNMGIWPGIAKKRRKNERQGNASNVIKKNILQRTARGSKQ